MKRVNLLILAFSLLLSLSACGAKSEPAYEGEYASQEAMAKGNSSAIEETVAKLASEDDFVFVSNGTEIQINGYKGNGGNIIIPTEIDGTPVTRIADHAFKDATSITGVVLPEKLQYIGGFAFVNLDNLRGVIVLPESVVEVGGHAFQSTGITGVVIQSDCELDVNAFANAYEMEFVYVADGCAPAIGTAVFGHNESLNVAVFPKDMYQIKDETFNACNALVIYTPVGSYAEKYAKNNFIQSDTDGYAEQVEYFTEIYG